MYRRRATLVTFHSLRPLIKVCTRPPNSSSLSFNNLQFSTKFTTAFQRPDFFNPRNDSNTETIINDFQQNQQNGNRVYDQNPSNQFQHNQNRNFGPAYIDNGPRNEFSEDAYDKNGRLSAGYGDLNQKKGIVGVDNGSNRSGMWQKNGYEYKRRYAGDIGQNGYGHDYGHGGLASSRNGVQQSGEESGGFNQSSNGVYSGVNGDSQQRWDRGNYGGNYENSQHSSLKPENLQQNWNAGHSGGDLGSSKQSWNAGYSHVSTGNLQQHRGAGYSGDNSGNSQQTWNTDNSGGSSGNSQHGWGVGYSDGSNGHPCQNWNDNYTQNAGMRQETSVDNYAGGTLQFRQGNYNANNLGIYHGNTGFSNNHGNVIEYQQIASGRHQSEASFGQQNLNQWESGYVGTLGQSSVKTNEESEVVEDDQLKGTMEELDKFYQERKLKEAIDVLGLLEEQRITVDLQRYLLLFKACGEEEALEEGKLIHNHLLRSGQHLEVKTHNAILKMYCSCGSLADAFKLFDKMQKRNLTTWDTMISWLAKNGHGEDSISVFTQFKETGLNPDGRMFLGVFSACGVIGDTVEGLLHFESMKKDYSIVPSMEHYISVIDMLGTAGNFDEALEFIENMPLEPSIEVWEVLMNLCRMHGNLELGDRCTELVEVLDPSRLDEQSKAGYLPLKPSELAKEKEKKKSGMTFPEGRSRVHEYRAGDKSQPELYELLRGMRQQLKEAGYIPELKFVLHDIDHEGKEEALMAHSERLAVAQGLMTSPARNPIRIIKNLRICVDCHNTMKIVSNLVGRELIIRDAKRFHHFKDGLCSCRDYW